MCGGVRKSGWPMPRLTIDLPAASSALARASTSNAVSVPSVAMRLASARGGWGCVTGAVLPAFAWLIEDPVIEGGDCKLQAFFSLPRRLGGFHPRQHRVQLLDPAAGRPELFVRLPA